MKINQIIIPYYFIIIYFLFILTPFHLNKILNKGSIETIGISFLTRKNNSQTKLPKIPIKDHFKDNAIDDDKDDAIYGDKGDDINDDKNDDINDDKNDDINDDKNDDINDAKDDDINEAKDDDKDENENEKQDDDKDDDDKYYDKDENENEKQNDDKYIPKGEDKDKPYIPERNNKDDDKDPPGRKDKNDKRDDLEEEDDDYRDWEWRTSDTVKNLSMYFFYLKNEVDTLNNDITKNKIFIVFNAFITGVLFLIIVIYSSIKCFLLCTKRREHDYNLSLLTDKLGELYVDDYEKVKQKKTKKKSRDYDAPSSVNNKKKMKKKTTFNPDNYKSSDEDKILYKPYKREDIE